MPFLVAALSSRMVCENASVFFSPKCEKLSPLNFKSLGSAHAVDSSEMSFRAAGSGAMRQAVLSANPIVLEPWMNVEINGPDEYQGEIISGINKRRGNITDSETKEGYVTINCEVGALAI